MLQHPAVNTPRSVRQRNKLRRQSQPVPPLFSPESIADIVVRAADDPPREIHIGRPTLQAVWAQNIAPDLLDRYLGRFGYESQLTDHPNPQVTEHTGDILDATLPGDPGAHGPYREQERGADLAMRLVFHRRLTVSLIGAAAVAAGALLWRR